MKLVSFLFLLLMIAVSRPAVPAQAGVLEDRIVILPPVRLPGSPPLDRDQVWRRLFNAYEDGIHGVTLISADKILRAMGGDTLDIDLVAIGEGMEIGKKFEADGVLMCEWDGTLHIQRLDPWSGEIAGPLNGDNEYGLVRDLEADRWIYGAGVVEDPPGYKAPGLDSPSLVATRYMHENGLFPQDALISLVEGVVRAQVIVTPNGVPVEVRILSVNPDHMGFTEATARTLWSLRYTPASRDGRPVYGIFQHTFTLSPTM